MIKIANEIDPENKIGCMLTAGKYEKSKDIYAKVKNSNYRISIWWVRPYFYSIKQLNQKEKLQREFEEILEQTAEKYEPSILTSYLLELAKAFNQ